MGDQKLTAMADELRTVATQFEIPVETLEKAQTNLYKNLPGGAPWGDDESGLLFAEKYVPGRDNVLKAVSDSIKGMRKNQRELNVMADNYEKVESNNSK
jgi:hypothetical protein